MSGYDYLDVLAYDDPRLPQWAKALRDVPAGEPRFNDHADPMFCVCGHTWGHHSEDGPCRPWWEGKTKHECGCQQFDYDTLNSRNKIGPPDSAWEAAK